MLATLSTFYTRDLNLLDTPKKILSLPVHK